MITAPSDQSLELSIGHKIVIIYIIFRIFRILIIEMSSILTTIQSQMDSVVDKSSVPVTISTSSAHGLYPLQDLWKHSQ